MSTRKDQGTKVPDDSLSNDSTLAAKASPSSQEPSPAPVREGRWMKISEAAEILGLSIDTVRRYADQGFLVAVRTPYGQRLISQASIEALLRRQTTG